jgi:hypothetical protein
LIKATSFVNEFALPLMDQSPEGRALLVWIPADSFMTSVLDGSMSDVESRLEHRWNRLASSEIQQLGRPGDLSPGERCAMSWLVEMLALDLIATRMPCRTRWQDFEQFLESPESVYAQIASFFRFPHVHFTEMHHQLLHRYAKRTEVHYDASFRRRLMDAALQKHREQISLGLAWLDRCAPERLRSHFYRRRNNAS